jgi:hypothetical protein
MISVFGRHTSGVCEIHGAVAQVRGRRNELLLFMRYGQSGRRAVRCET